MPASTAAPTDSRHSRSCHVFEVDHPATQAFKRTRLRGAVALQRRRSREARRRGLRARRSRPTRCCDAGYDVRVPSVFLWEGVTNYLTPAAVDDTLAAIRRLTCPGSVLLFTYVDARGPRPRPGRVPGGQAMAAAVRKRGEPWTFGLGPASLQALSARSRLRSGRVTPRPPKPRDAYFPRGDAESAGRLCTASRAPRSAERTALRMAACSAPVPGDHAGIFDPVCGIVGYVGRRARFASCCWPA